MGGGGGVGGCAAQHRWACRKVGSTSRERHGDLAAASSHHRSSNRLKPTGLPAPPLHPSLPGQEGAPPHLAEVRCRQARGEEEVTGLAISHAPIAVGVGQAEPRIHHGVGYAVHRSRRGTGRGRRRLVGRLAGGGGSNSRMRPQGCRPRRAHGGRRPGLLVGQLGGQQVLHVRVGRRRRRASEAAATGQEGCCGSRHAQQLPHTGLVGAPGVSSKRGRNCQRQAKATELAAHLHGCVQSLRHSSMRSNHENTQ